MIQSRRQVTERRLCALAIALLGLLRAAPTLAQGEAPAEMLFEQGKVLMRDKHYEEACAKFKASHDLDKNATGTLLNLALCHEAINKRATAWAEFRQVAAESAGKREDRVAVAREHEAKLLPTLSYVTIVVEPQARVPQLKIELDANPIDDAAWGTELAIDPGKHVVRTLAPGRPAGDQELVIDGERVERRSLVIVLPEPTPASRAAAPVPQNSRRTLGIVLGSAGIATIGVGLIFGLVATNKNRHLRTLCDHDVCPDEPTRSEARDELRAAKTDALVSDITIGVGAAAVLAGAYFFITSRAQAPSSSPSAVRVMPLASAHDAKLQMSVTW